MMCCAGSRAATNEPQAMKATVEQADRAHRFAHDLRNRLAAIQQVLQHVKEGGADPAQLELLEFAEQQYFKAMRTTEEFMDDLGVDRGVGELQRSTIDLGALVGASIASLQHRLDRKHQHVELNVQHSVTVNVDPHWITELVNALLSNASKYTPNEGRIHVELERRAEVVIVTVRDTGVGLDPEDLQMIFTRYAWLKSRSTAGEAQGRSTLARANQWAKAHGGDLTATSEGPGLGCSFTLRLPL